MRDNSNTRFEEWETRKLQDPRFRAAVEELEPAHQITRLRIMRGLTQEELARLVGTRQPSIARLESGRSEPTLSFLRRVAQALGGHLEVRIIAPEEEMAAEKEPISISTGLHTLEEEIPVQYADAQLGLGQGRSRPIWDSLSTASSVLHIAKVAP